MQHIDRVARSPPHNPSREIDHGLFAREPENIEDIALAYFYAAKGDQLIEHRFRITEASFRSARDRVRRRGLKRDLFFSGDQLQVLRDQVCRNAMEVEPLTAAENGGQNLLRFGRRENKFHMLGRLFQRLQKRIKRCSREHVHLVDQINFVTALCRSITDVLAQLTYIFNTVVTYT